jgi:glycosyltransferase involved in cell wall biosynthesis
VVLSGFLKEIFDQYDIPCVVIPNIVVLQPPIKRNTDIAPKFISIRHLEPLYNIPCMLRAYEQVLQHYPEATLDILGKGALREELEAMVEKHHLTGVTFVGQVPNQQIYDYLANADVMLSAAKADNMPVSLLEAMNAGLLVISSRVGGVPYMIVDGSQTYRHSLEDGVGAYSLEFRGNDRPTGLLFESDDVDDMAAKMMWALEHPQEVKTMIHNAQADVQKYAWENVKQQLMKVYE